MIKRGYPALRRDGAARAALCLEEMLARGPSNSVARPRFLIVRRRREPVETCDAFSCQAAIA
jgi:hypothetical protein